MAQHSQVSAKQVATAISNIIDLTQRPRALKIASYRRVTDAVVTLGGIDREEFFAFAEGRIDRFGNPINLSFLNQQRASLNSLPLSELDAPVSKAFKDLKKSVEDRINREIEITKLADPFLSALRKTVRSLQGRVAGHATDADVAQNANVLKAAYETLERDFGSLTQLVQRTRGSASSVKSSRASDRSVRAAAAWPWPWKVQGAPRGVEELARASGSICCQINMSCESDTVDCGTLDLCENDQCGVGDSDSPCRVYDSGGCQCKIEDT